jgi:hypothetical protein
MGCACEKQPLALVALRLIAALPVKANVEKQDDTGTRKGDNREVALRP